MEKQRYRISREQREKLRRSAERRKEYTKKRRRRRKKNNKALKPLLLILLILIAILLFRCWRNRPKPYLAADDTLAVHFIDVGQGDCTLLACDGKIMLIDCGEYQQSSKVVSYLKDRGVSRIDYLVATHPHSDHMGGMAGIVKSFDIGEIIVPPLDDQNIPTTVFYEKFLDACEEKGYGLTEASVGDVIELGDARAEIIAPLRSSYDDLNDSSVALMINHGSNSFLLTGDAEFTSESEMLAGGRLHHVTVYKAGHHGSSSSSSAALLSAITPDIAVISCGEGNPYGHPSGAVIERLGWYADRIYRTDKDGTVIIESDGRNVRRITDDNT